MGKNDVFLNDLIQRFKMRTPMAVSRLRSAVYGYAEVREGIRPRQHANRIAGLAKAAEIPSIYNQLTVIYNSLQLDFRRDIREPSTKTTIHQFFEELDSKADIWQEMADRNRNRRPEPPPRNRRMDSDRPTY